MSRRSPVPLLKFQITPSSDFYVIFPGTEWKKADGDQIDKNAVGGACSTRGGEERSIQGFGGET